MARGLLESEGVPATLAGEHHVGANWAFSQALGGVKLQVSAEHEAKAREILLALRNGEFAAALEAEFNLSPVSCPNCSSTELQVIRSKKSILLNFVTFFFASAPFPPKIAGLKCTTCGTMVPDAL